MTAIVGTDCGCGGGSTTSGASITSASAGPTSAGERTRFYSRQLISAADLTQDQLYFREKHRRHNRMLHGWGIVCGAEVRVSPDKPGYVDVNAGYILGPFGDEIMIDDVISVDLSAQNADGDAMNGCLPPDPWCADVKVARPAGQPVYLAIAYAEFACRPVQTATSGCGCGCEETACEYSRWRDSYRIRVLDTLPDTYEAVMTPPLPDIAVSCRTSRVIDMVPKVADAVEHGDERQATGCNCPTCRPCPTSPWVILADITVDGDDITIDCDAHRRYVASFRDFYYMCRHATQAKPVDLGEMFSKAALDRLRTHADIAQAILSASGRDLKVNVAASSPLGKHLAGQTITDIALQPQDSFVATATSGVSAGARPAAIETARQVWEKAVQAKRLADGL
jgi:hypothetical protein